jgi:putative Mn2+ efflux pump MntP
MVMLSVATSIDALAVGLSLALIGVDIWTPALVIGVTASTLTVAGMLLGGRIGMIWGKRVEVTGGLVLLAIGLKILAEHLG